jgi:hypothetical protein
MRTAILLLFTTLCTTAIGQVASNNNDFQDVPETPTLVSILDEIEEAMQVHFLYEASLVQGKFV